MTDEELQQLLIENNGCAVKVTANDYSYDGFLVFGGRKLSLKVRAVVEDVEGRLFIHNASQLTKLK